MQWRGPKGSYFWTPEGKRFIDFNSQLMSVNIGHGDRRVIDAIREQAELVTYVAPSFSTEPRARLGAKLAGITPGDIDVFFFTNGGADANETAFKIARAYTGRSKIISFYRSYHGGTAGAMAATGEPRGWLQPPLPGFIHVLSPHHGISRPSDTSDDALRYLEEVIQLEGPPSIAAIIMESVVGTNGILIPPDGYYQGLRALCDKYGILLIADEVMTGFGLYRRVVRGRSLERRARHHHDGQRADERVRAVGRRWNETNDRRDFSGQTVSRRAHL